MPFEHQPTMTINYTRSPDRAVNPGLNWVRPPEFLPRSLTYLDEHFVEYWHGRDAPREGLGGIESVPLSALFDGFPQFEARELAVIGHQKSQQLLRAEPFKDIELREYVLQAKTVEPGYDRSVLYIRLAEWSPESAENNVPMPPPDHILVAMGL